MPTEEFDLVKLAREQLAKASAQPDDDDDEDEVEQEVEVDDEVEEVEEPKQEVEPPSPRSTVIRDYLKEQFKADLSDDIADEDLAPQIASFMTERQRLAEENEQLRQMVAASRQAPREEKAPDKKEEKPRKWSTIEYDPDWEKAAELDMETRQWVPKTKFGAWGIEAANRLNDYARAQAERARKLTADPLSALREAGLDDYIQEIRKQIADELRAEQENALRGFAGATAVDRERQEIEKFFDDHRTEYFKVDTKGEVLRDMNGSPILSSKGEAYRNAVVEAREIGIQDQRAIHKYAMRLSGAVTPPPSPPEPPKSAEEKNKEQKRKFLERGKTKKANRLANREGSVVAARERGEPQNPGLSFRDMVFRDPDNADILGANFQG